MGAKQEMATIAKLQRAAAIGAEIEVILGDVGLQKLSKQAWLGMAAEMAGGVDLDELRQQIEALPYLADLVRGVAGHWRDTGQDRPVGDWAFRQGRDHYAAPYAERLMAQISVEQASAVAAVLVADAAPEERWGRLASFDEIEAMTSPLYAEIEALDDQLARTLLLGDVSWDGHRATLRAGAVSVVLDSDTAARPASALAEGARNAARGLQQAA